MTVAGNIEIPSLEDLLLDEGIVAPAQLERARRIAQRLRKPRPPGELLVEMGQLARAEYDRIVRSHRGRLSLAEILHEDGILTDEGLRTARAAAAEAPGSSERHVLVAGGLVPEAEYLRALGARYDIPMVEPDVGLVDQALLARASMRYLSHNCALPLRIGDGALTVILADPTNGYVIADLERIFEVPVRPCCATEGSILAALDTLRLLREGKGQSAAASLQYHEMRDIDVSRESGEGAVAVLDSLLQRAIQMRASDLHIEPLESKVRIRLRVDGGLVALTELPLGFAPQLISRVKVLAGMDITERRHHQDGRIGVRFDGGEVDIRVSSYNSVFGETLVLRLLDRRRGLVALEDLGMEPRVLATLREIVLRGSSGLVLVTGPTGSGKTTSLYSFVDYLNAPDVKTISCEDPVEYVLQGVTQCSIQVKAGLTFPDSLRAMMRQDPDIIVVGEIRDEETAHLAVEAALTGHRVFSTFHTEDAVGAIVRLLEMGIPPFLIASTLTCVISQRLLRRVCAACRTTGEAAREDLRFLGLRTADLSGYELARGEGCDACAGTGYQGRAGVHEVLMPDDAFRDATLSRPPSRELRRLARQIPMFLTLQEAGLLKVASGQTTFEELASQCPRDPDARPLAELRRLTGGKGLL